MSQDLPRRLRATAERYRPDTERMWRRVDEGMRQTRTDRPSPARSRFRVPALAVATAVAVVLIGAIVVTGYLPQRGQSPAPAGPGDDSPTARTAPAPPPAPDAVDGLDCLDVTGSINPGGNDYWSQADLIVTVHEPVEELSVELRVVLDDGVEPTGSWTTADHYFAPAQVTEADGYLVFAWELSGGAPLAPGEYTLAGQYDHGQGPRDPGGDHYVFDAVAASGSGVVIGGFD